MPAPSRFTYRAYRTGGQLLQHLPEPVAALGATGVGTLLGSTRRDARNLYARHLRRVLGPRVSDAEVRKMTRLAFVSYARYWLEGARLSSTSPEVIKSRMSVESGFEHLVEGMKAGKGVIMALPHVGSWEWGGAWLALLGYPMTAVVEPLASEELYDWFVREREAMGLRIVKLDDEAVSSLLAVLRSGGLVGLLCDRDIVGNGVEVEFFGERTTLPAGPAMLALRTGAALLPTAVYSGPGEHHTGLIRPPIPTERSGRLRDDVARVTQCLAHELEFLIRRAPEQWHLFQPNWPSDFAQSRDRREAPADRVGGPAQRAVGAGRRTAASISPTTSRRVAATSRRNGAPSRPTRRSSSLHRGELEQAE